jgi:light-regulated signal transduction histidine kinase (bacteriophytochrome)
METSISTTYSPLSTWKQRRALESRVQARTQALELEAAELRARADQLQASVAELDAFADTVSHDLRAPLRAMDGFSHILLERHASEVGAEAARYLDYIRSNAQRMQKLVDGLLAFSRLGSKALDRVRLSPGVLVHQALSDLGAESRSADLYIEVEEDLPECTADPALLKLVFANLIANAIKFSRNSEPARIQVGAGELHGQTAYFVRDNGIGFEQSQAEKIFGVFQRLNRAEDFEGTGVGLALVQRIVQKHGGRIWAHAEPGRGATFSFTLATTGRP